MKSTFYRVVGCALLAGFLACAHGQPSQELLKARVAYSDAENGPASSLDPADLHEARRALDAAEQASAKNPQSPEARQSAYLALRRAELADSQGKAAAALKVRDELVQVEQVLKDELLARTQSELAATAAQAQEAVGALAATQSQLDQLNKEKAQAQQQTDAEHGSNVAFDQKEAAALAKLGAVKNDDRGTVLTLPGKSVFAPNKSVLLPSAQRRLDDVADALRGSPRMIRIEAHSDSRGSDAANLALTQSRAEAVMEYLVSRDIPQSRITAVGQGASHPLADNGTPEGRAENRRVEIILLRNTTASNDAR